MVTQRDVARRAGVSVRTVSNVVNDFPYVSDAMRERVQRVIDETGYQPNIAARTLRRGRSGLIGLVVPELDVPYFAELTRSFVEQLSGRDLTLVVDQTDGDGARERDIVMRSSRAALFDGLIFNPLVVRTAELTRRKVSTPLVLIGEQVEDTAFDHVVIDNVRAAREATEHLLSLGRSRIAIIGDGAGAGMRTSTLRGEGYRLALEGAGQAYQPELSVGTTHLHRADGAAGMAQLLALAEPPDAVFCLNDLVAMGALRELAQRGVKVPDDIAIIGFDDIEEGRFSTPTLSTVSPDKSQIARLAIDRLLQRMGGDTSRGVEVLADHRFLARESTLGRASTYVRVRRRKGRPASAGILGE